MGKGGSGSVWALRRFQGCTQRAGGGERRNPKAAAESIGFCAGGSLVWHWAGYATSKDSDVGGVSQLQGWLNALFPTMSWNLVL